jgi:diphosphomevalonate decarboxylase
LAACRGEGAGLLDFCLNGEPHGLSAADRLISASLSLFPVSSVRMAIVCKKREHFPHSAGIASSAAAFSALSLCICHMEQHLDGGDPYDVSPGFIEKASFMARLGSGSACRSLEGGFVVWGETPLVPGSAWEAGIRLPEKDADPKFFTLRDAILIVDDSEKEVSSSAGHALMQRHAYRSGRIEQAASNMEKMLTAIRKGDEALFFRVLENEALGLHGLMMSSDPGYVLMRPATLQALERIRNFRKRSGLSLGFTMDAGPNIHLIYFDRDAETVRAFIEDELALLCSRGRWIDDGIGTGPVPVRP